MGQAETHSNTKVKPWIIYIALYTVTTLNFISTSLFSPPINRQLRVLQVSPFVLGIIGSIYGATNLISSPFVGFGCNRYGVSFVFMLALTGTLLNNLAQIFTISLPVFILARTSAGFLKHTATLGKMLLAQFAARNEVAWGLGYLGAFSNLGVVIGPSLGACFLQFEDGLKLLLMLAITMYMIMLFITTKLLWISPQSRRFDDKEKELSKKTDTNSEHTCCTQQDPQSNSKVPQSASNPKQKHRFNQFRVFFQSDWELISIFILKFCFNFASHCIRSHFPLLMQRKYFATESAMGYLNSIQSTSAMLVGFVVSPVIYYTYRNNLRKVILHAGCLQMISFICQIISPTFFWSSVSFLLLEVSNPFLWVGTAALALEYKPPPEKMKNGHERQPTQLNTTTMLSLSTTLAHISSMLAPLCAGSVVLSNSKIFNENDGAALLSACSALVGVLVTLLFIPTLGSESRSTNKISKSDSDDAQCNDESGVGGLSKLKQG